MAESRSGIFIGKNCSEDRWSSGWWGVSPRTSTFERHVSIRRPHAGIPLANGRQGVLVWGDSALKLTLAHAGHGPVADVPIESLHGQYLRLNPATSDGWTRDGEIARDPVHEMPTKMGQVIQIEALPFARY